MPVKNKQRRADSRYALLTELGAEIEFDVPDGGRCRLQMLDISGLGVAFTIPEPIPEIEVGVSLADAQIHIGALVIRGNLTVQHISKHKCGAQFFPASDTDRNELTSLLSRLDLLSRPPFGTERQRAD